VATPGADETRRLDDVIFEDDADRMLRCFGFSAAGARAGFVPAFTSPGSRTSLARGMRTFAPQCGQTPRLPARKAFTCNFLSHSWHRNLIPMKQPDRDTTGKQAHRNGLSQQWIRFGPRGTACRPTLLPEKRLVRLAARAKGRFAKPIWLAIASGREAFHTCHYTDDHIRVKKPPPSAE